MKKFKIQRKRIKFEYEFTDGDTAKFEYLEPTTKQIDKSVELESVSEQMDFAKKTLRDCLVSETDGAVEKLIREQVEDGNIYEFRVALDEELGKLKKSA